VVIIVIVSPLFSGKREIMALAVKCNNVAQGCEWKGIVGTLQKHASTCEFTLVPCPNNCEDGEDKIGYFRKKHLRHHFINECPNREYKCRYCGEKGTYANITQVHDKTCVNKIVPCPNEDCIHTIQRKNVEKHLEDCEFTEVACKYARLGCDSKMKKTDLPAHEKEDTLHLHMALDKIVTIEKEVSYLKSKIALHFTFKITCFAERMKNGGVFLSPSFYTSPNGYHMDIKVHPDGKGDCKGTHISIYAKVLKGKNDEHLTWPFVGNITFTLLNQLEDEDHFGRTAFIKGDINMRATAGTVNNRGFSRFIAHSGLSRKRSIQYLKDDTLYFRVSVDIPSSTPWLNLSVDQKLE
jgi:TNF receptor-associated factor 4